MSLPVHFTCVIFHKYVNYDHPGESIPEGDIDLTFRQLERKSSSDSSKLWNISGCYNVSGCGPDWSTKSRCVIFNLYNLEKSISHLLIQVQSNLVNQCSYFSNLLFLSFNFVFLVDFYHFQGEVGAPGYKGPQGEQGLKVSSALSSQVSTFACAYPSYHFIKNLLGNCGRCWTSWNSRETWK